jgi:hypothetical protein
MAKRIVMDIRAIDLNEAGRKGVKGKKPYSKK